MSNGKWNVDTLKEHFEKILTEKDKAINIALAAAKEAVGVAEANAEKWRDNANEWRGAMTDREKSFMPRIEFEAYKTETEKALNLSQGKSAGLSQGWIFLIGAVGMVGGVVGIASFFMK